MQERTVFERMLFAFREDGSMDSLPRTDRVSVAVVTGGHPFDVPGFHALFRSLPGADCYIQHLEDYVSDAGKVREAYDVVLFYTMPRGVPPEPGRGYEGRIGRALERLGKTEQGIFLLHHAILTYADWPFWSEMVGIADREISSYHHGMDLRIEVADRDHPITRGLDAWEMVDETYVMDEPDGSVLLTADHPQSMKTIGWARTFGRARVFCFQSGHDNQTWVNPNFREVVARGIRWCAGRI